jgi:AmmeMemoRadiSam system protein A
MLDAPARRVLLGVARDSIEQSLLSGARAPFSPSGFSAPLTEWRSTFVTLMLRERLRGCCGRLEPERPLIEDVWHNAYAAGFQDPRFDPLAAHELSNLQIEVSILAPLERIDVNSTEELLAALTPGKHGLVLGSSGQRVTFIPHVWEGIPDATTFVRELRRKAGWLDEGWQTDLEAWRFEAEAFSS